MNGFKLFLISTSLIATSSIPAMSSNADPSANLSDGNLIAEPTLSDYLHANRAPGILVEPYDIVDSDQ